MLAAQQWAMVIAISLLAGLDRTALAQTLLSRPLVCACATGLVLGNFSVAFQVGLLLELLWLMRLPVGAAVAPDDTQAAIAAVLVLRVYSGPGADSALLLALVVLVVAILAEAGKCCDIWARHINERLFIQADPAHSHGGLPSITACNNCGLAVFALASLLSLTLITATTVALIHIGAVIIADISLAHPAWLYLPYVLVGVAAVLVALNMGRRMVLLFAGSYLLALVVLELC